MAIMRIDDEIRLNIFEALLSENTVSPNIRQIQKHTGYHKATIKSSLDFLKKEGVLTGFGPKIDFKKFDYRLETVVLWQIDMSNRPVFQKIVETAKKDENLYRLSGIIGPHNWNFLSHHIYRDVESYHRDITKKYYESIPGVFDAIKDRQIIFETEPFYKAASRTEALIKIIRKHNGLDRK
ncbi:MAG: hypothetical protein Q7K34_03835 [archaeon]|nr:hypothetical protein [archaeon]